MGVEREERIGGDTGALFTGRVLSEDRDSVFRNMRYREQAGMMPAPVCLWNCRNFKDLFHRDI